MIIAVRLYDYSYQRFSAIKLGPRFYNVYSCYFHCQIAVVQRSVN